MKRKATEKSQSAKVTKTRININIDSDVIDFFQERAAHPGADPYQTQMNKVLRAYMESAKRMEGAHSASQVATSVARLLISDEDFVLAVAERVNERRRRKC